MIKWACLALGTLAGGFARYILAGVVYNKLGTAFPYGTLVVNLAGCLLIGFFHSLAEDKLLLGPEARVLLMIGFCGAFTTFSTLILETSNLWDDGEFFRGFLNLGISVFLGYVLLWLGALLGRII